MRPQPHGPEAGRPERSRTEPHRERGALSWGRVVWDALLMTWLLNLVVGVDLWKSTERSFQEVCEEKLTTHTSVMMEKERAGNHTAIFIHESLWQEGNLLSRDRSTCQRIPFDPTHRRSLGEGNGDPLQHACLENPMNSGAWRATVYGVTKSWARLKWLSMQHTYEKPGIVKFIGSEGTLVDAGAKGRGLGSGMGS